MRDFTRPSAPGVIGRYLAYIELLGLEFPGLDDSRMGELSRCNQATEP